jgi:hypothetical protein
MNVIAAVPGWRSLAVWGMPPVAYALASDTPIGVIRSLMLIFEQRPDKSVELRGFEPLTFCMPCRFRKSETVGLSRSGSSSPAQTIRAGRGESASV